MEAGLEAEKSKAPVHRQECTTPQMLLPSDLYVFSRKVERGSFTIAGHCPMPGLSREARPPKPKVRGEAGAAVLFLPPLPLKKKPRAGAGLRVC